MLRLGDINFGLGVQTSGLDASIQKIIAFGDAVDRAAQRSVKGAKEAEAALRAQERAMTQSLQRVANLQQTLIKSKAPSGIATGLSADFDKYVGILTKAKVSTLDFQRANIMMGASLQSAARSLKTHQQNIRGLGEDVSPVTKALQSLSNAAVLITGPLGGVATRITTLRMAFQHTGLALTAFIAGAAAAAYATIKMGSAVASTAIEFNGLENRLKIVEGTTNGAGDAFKYLTQLAYQTGTNISVLTNEYAAIAQASRNTSIRGQELRDVFSGITVATAKFHLSAEDTRGVLIALEQMLSKGTVQSQELRNQLGNRLPGAFNIAAQAMGVTTAQLDKLLQKGKIASAEFVPKFVDTLLQSLGVDTKSSIDTLQASMANVGTAATLFNKKMGDMLDITQRMQSGLKTTAATIRFLTDHMETITAAIIGATAAISLFLIEVRAVTATVAAAAAIQRMYAAITSVSAGMSLAGAAGAFFGRVVVGLTTGIRALTIAIMANPIGALTSVFARLAVAILGGTAAYYVMQRALSSTSDAQGSLTAEVDEYIKSLDQAGRTSVQTTDDYIAKLSEEKTALDSVIQKQGERILKMQEYQKAIPQNPIADAFGKVMGLHSITSALGLDLQTNINSAQQTYADSVRQSLSMTMKQIQLNEVRAEQQKKITDELRAQAIAKQADLAKLDREIDHMNALADAYKQSVGAGKALEDQYKKITAIEKFTKELEKHETDVRKVRQEVEKFSAAWDNLESSKGLETLRKYNLELSDLQAKAAAILQGPAQVTQLDEAIAKRNQLKQWEADLRQAGVQGQELTDRLNALGIAIDGVNKASKEFALAEKLRDVNRQIRDFNGEVAAMKEGPAALEKFKRATQAANSVEDLTRELIKQGMAADQAKAKAEEYGKAMLNHSTAAAIQQQSQALQDMQNQIQTYRIAIPLIQKYNLSFNDGQDVAKFALALRDAGASQAQINTAVQQYIQLRQQANQVEAAFAGQQQAVEGIAKSWSDAFDSVGTAITDALANGKNFGDSMASILRTLGSQLVNLFLQLTILNPLKNQLLNPSTPFPTVSPTGFLGGLFGNKGNIAGNAIAPAASPLGGIVGGSTPANPVYVSPVATIASSTSGSSVASVLSQPSAASTSSAASTISSAVERGVTPAIKAVTEPIKLASASTTSVMDTLKSALVPGKAMSSVTGMTSNMQQGLAAMIKDAPGKISIFSGYRSVAHQRELWDQALAKYGSPDIARKWVAPPGMSQHNFGNAADLRFSDPQTMQWAHANAGKYGLKFPLGNENWHVETLGTRGGSKGFDYSALNASTKKLESSIKGVDSSLNTMKTSTTAVSTAQQTQQATSQAVATADQTKAASAQIASTADTTKAASANIASTADTTKATSTTLAATAEQTAATASTVTATQVSLLGTASTTAAASMATSSAMSGMGGFMGAFFEKGGAWNRGVRFAARGMMLNSPTMFSTSSGPVIGGEAGTEAIMPLGRDAQGRLGVMNHDNGPSRRPMVQNIYAQDLRTVTKSKYQLAAMGGAMLMKGSKFR